MFSVYVSELSNHALIVKVLFTINYIYMNVQNYVIRPFP